MARDTDCYRLGTYIFHDGKSLPDAYIAYSTYGKLNANRDNAIVAPTWFSGTPEAFEWLIGPGRPLDTDRYFIVAPSMFGNGLSSSPSNTPAPYDGPRFPHHTIADNVRAQHELIVNHLGISQVQLVFGGSMGTMQAYQWALSYPELVSRVFAACGSARVSEHCSVFLSGAEAALTADQKFGDGDYDAAPLDGLKAVGRVWSAWSPSPRFFRDREFEQLGFASAEQFVSEFWESWYASLDANNFLNQLWTWRHADISDNPEHRGDLAAALADIPALTYVVPAERDPYFPVEDSTWEAEQMPNGQLRVIPGTWGHFVLFGSHEPSALFISDAVREILNTPVAQSPNRTRRAS
jgi:homoserine O-acetyltransferase/O-succinyltransferase